MPARVLYQLGVLIQRHAEAEWNAWHEGHHMRAVIQQPGFRTARKFKLAEEPTSDSVEYLVQYELENIEALHRYLQSGEAARLRKEHEDRFGAKTSIARKTYIETISMKKEFTPKGERIWDSSHLTKSRKS